MQLLIDVDLHIVYCFRVKHVLFQIIPMELLCYAHFNDDKQH